MNKEMTGIAIKIRPAELNDAEVISRTLIASITQLCSLDHHNDASAIAAWVENKTEDNIKQWIRDEEAALFLAEIGTNCAGVAGIGNGGVITLNYVHPEFRFCGVSKVLLTHMENKLAGFGYQEGRLTSTKTAHRFYRKHGWSGVPSSDDVDDTDGFPMTKRFGS